MKRFIAIKLGGRGVEGKVWMVDERDPDGIDKVYIDVQMWKEDAQKLANDLNELAYRRAESGSRS